MKLFKIFLSALALLVVYSATAYAAVPALQTAKITGPHAVTLTFTEPTVAAAVDFTNMTGDLSGRTVQSVSGINTNVLVLTVDGQPLKPNAIGSIVLNSGIYSTSDNSRMGTTTRSVADGQAPSIVSLSASVLAASSQGFALDKGGDIVTVSFSANELIDASVVTIAGQTVTAPGAGSGPYSANYTIPASSGLSTVPFTISVRDASQNTSPTFSGFISLSASGVAPTPVSTTPVVTTPASGTSQPQISQIYPVPTPSQTATPIYTFYSTTAGTATYVGDCTTNSSAVAVGTNTVVFNTLAEGDHSNCALTVKDSAGATSNTLFIPEFTIETGSGSVEGESTAKKFQFTRDLRLNMTGEDVSELQRRLTKEGLYKGPVTGKFGALTRAAVVAYQKKNKLKQLGVVGPGTRKLLNQK
ncbi:MAG TPA: peptidoglycan-binding protein [Patescibacteria group bacterium]|nr:peptidoglycan-binding protein [Patescibacteria group bacterium]